MFYQNLILTFTLGNPKDSRCAEAMKSNVLRLVQAKQKTSQLRDSLHSNMRNFQFRHHICMLCIHIYPFKLRAISYKLNQNWKWSSQILMKIGEIRDIYEQMKSWPFFWLEHKWKSVDTCFELWQFWYLNMYFEVLNSPKIRNCIYRFLNYYVLWVIWHWFKLDIFTNKMLQRVKYRTIFD